MGETRGIHDRAAENLVFIREAMERAGSFTAVPGWGGVVMGLTGLAAAIIAPAQPTATGRPATWLGAAVIATTAGIIPGLIKIGRASGRERVAIPGGGGSFKI